MFSLIILLSLLNSILNATECPFSGIKIENYNSTMVNSSYSRGMLPTTACASLSPQGTIENDKNSSSFKEVTAQLRKTLALKKEPVTSYAPIIPVLPGKTSFDTFARKDDYKKGILQDIDPAIKTHIQTELGLTPHEMENIVFLHDTTETSTPNAYAYSGPNVIVFNKEMYDFAIKASRALSKTIVCYSPTYVTHITFPPRLALRIFLAICSHEIEHLRKQHTVSTLATECEADKAILLKHMRAHYVYQIIRNVMLCYHEPIPIKTKQWLVNSPATAIDDQLKIRDRLFSEHSHQFYHEVYTEKRTHPSHSERAKFNKQQVQIRSSQAHNVDSPAHECAIVTITPSVNSIPKVLFRQMLICESFAHRINSHP